MALASKIGKPTGETTKAGRPVYKTPEGEFVSEKSVTIPVNGKWVNASSIWNGRRIDEDGVMRLIKEGAIKPTSVHDTEEEAIAAAKKRSSSLMRKKYQAGGMSTDYEQQIMDMQGTAPEGSEDSFGKALTEISADLTPGIGEVRSAMDAKKSFEEGDALGVGLGVLGAVPGIGIGARGLKSFVKAGKVAEGVKNLNSVSDEAFETVLKEIPPPKLKGTKEDDPFELINVNREEWRAANKKKYKKPESEMVLQDAALKLDAGEITPQEFRKLADKAAPYSYNTKVPKLYTDEAVAASLPTEKFVKQHGIIGLNKAVPEGAQVESRFDINAYLHYNVYTATIQGVK